MRQRAGYARRNYRRSLGGFLLRNRGRLLVLVLGYAAAMAVISFLTHGYLRGLLHGILIAAAMASVLVVHMAITGSIWQIAGAWGEDNTNDTLRWAKRRRLIHGWVRNVEVEGGDVDHLVAVAAGWIAIDSKWHSQELDAKTVARDAARAQKAARRASLVLRSLGHPETVRPVVVLWGGSREDIPGLHATAYEVEFMSGSYLKTWLRELPSGTVDRRTAKEVLDDLRRFRARVRPQM